MVGSELWLGPRQGVELIPYSTDHPLYALPTRPSLSPSRWTRLRRDARFKIAHPLLPNSLLPSAQTTLPYPIFPTSSFLPIPPLFTPRTSQRGSQRQTHHVFTSKPPLYAELAVWDPQPQPAELAAAKQPRGWPLWCRSFCCCCCRHASRKPRCTAGL